MPTWSFYSRKIIFFHRLKRGYLTYYHEDVVRDKRRVIREGGGGGEGERINYTDYESNITNGREGEGGQRCQTCLPRFCFLYLPFHFLLLLLFFV